MKPFKINNPDVVRKVLNNGLTVLVQPLPMVASVSIGLNVNIGSRDELPSEAGLSHLIEHMLFQGTVRRDTRELSRVINAVGGNLDACTGRESTTYYAKVPSHQLELAMDVLADMLQHSSFSAHKLAKEKHVILEEIRMCEDTPDELVNDIFLQTIWPRHSLGRSILGTRKSLSAIGRRQVLDYFKTHYQPHQLIVAVAGNVSVSRVMSMAEKYFSHMPRGDKPAQPLNEVKIPRIQCMLKARTLEQVHVCLGVPGLAYTDSRRLAALAFSNILGGGTNSRLFYEVREKRALVYTVYSFVDFFRDTGLAGVYLACHPKKMREALTVICDQIRNLIEKPISDQEWLDVREQMRGNYLISLESSSAHMWHILQQETYQQEHLTQTSILRSIAAISKLEIRSLAKQLFSKQTLSLSVVGPVKKQVWMELSI